MLARPVIADRTMPLSFNSIPRHWWALERGVLQTISYERAKRVVFNQAPGGQSMPYKVIDLGDKALSCHLSAREWCCCHVRLMPCVKRALAVPGPV